MHELTKIQTQKAATSSPVLRNKGMLQRAAVKPAPAQQVPPIVQDVLRSSGQPLDATTRALMEPRFGHDFSQVRVHSGAAAEQSARDVSANAYAVGHNIVFGAGRFAPWTHEGRRLLAHELTHVVQQSRGGAAPSLDPHSSSEHAAEQAASDLNRTRGPIQVSGATAPSLAREQATPQKQPNIDIKITKQVDRTVITLGDELIPIAEGRVPIGEIDSRVIRTPQKIEIVIVIPEGGEMILIHSSSTALLKLSAQFQIRVVRKLKVPVKTFSELEEGSSPPKQFETVSELTGQRPQPKPVSSKPASPKTAPVPPTPTPEPTKLPEGSGTAATPSAVPAPYGPARVPGEGQEKKPEAKGAPLPPSPSPKQAPPAAVGEIKELTELIKKASDAATKDPLVRKLRDVLSGLQPIIPASDAKSMIDDAIRSLVKDGADEAIMAILKTITGKAPSTMPENRNQTGPDVPQKDLGEHVFQGPKIPIKDAPAPAPKFSFQYRNGPQKSYEPGAVIKFTLVPPDNFSSLQGAKRLVIVAEADRNTPNPDRFARIDLEAASPKPIELQAPLKPGKYVIRVDIGLGFDYSNMQEFEVSTPQKK